MAVWVTFLEILSCLLIHNAHTALVIFFIAGLLGYLSLLPLMSSAAKLAHNTGVESSLFAVLMSIFNVGQAAATFLGGWFSEKIGTQPLILVTAVLTLSGLWVVKKLKSL